MRYAKSVIVLITLMLAALLVLGQSALAGPPEKPGNPGLPGCLSEVAAKEAEIAALQGQVNALTEQVNKLQNQALVPQTGQTESYAPGDDGDLQKGISWPVPRFTDHGDGTVTDNLTGLMWTNDMQQIPGTMFWDDALTACNEFVFAGFDDWRVPNVRELQSLIDYGRRSPALPSDHPFIINEELTSQFASGAEVFFWSSTNALAGPNIYAFIVDMNLSKMVYYHKNYGGISVWPVRGGK